MASGARDERLGHRCSNLYRLLKNLRGGKEFNTEILGMSENGKTRQERTTEKRPILVHLPTDLRAFLESYATSKGMSMSSVMVWLLRRERSTGNHSDITT